MWKTLISSKVTPMVPVMRSFVFHHSWWLFGIPAALFVAPDEVALALALSSNRSGTFDWPID